MKAVKILSAGLMIGLLCLAGCVQKETKLPQTSEYESFLDDFLKMLSNGQFEEAVNLVINSSGKQLSEDKKNKLVSMWNVTFGGDLSYEILNSTKIDESMLAGTPFDEGRMFTVRFIINGSESSTAYFVVRYNDKLWIWLPPMMEELLEMAP
ncbi:MAG: hypothetical protein DRN18_02410 [Thermoplasmata archaeon]|mgnify:CR=1 FL=1|nr:MAG: hypothetical protein DRN18_02410 [Thermoplasmata archaeon]